MANLKIYKPPPPLHFCSNTPIFPYPPIYTKKIRPPIPPPLKQFFPTFNPPSFRKGGWGVQTMACVPKLPFFRKIASFNAFLEQN